MTLPTASLAEVAVEVGLMARREKRDLDNFEYQMRVLHRVGEDLDIREAARLQKIAEVETSETRERALRLTQAFDWLMLLKEHEDEIRDLVESKIPRAAA
jgi:hypothetical protein